MKTVEVWDFNENILEYEKVGDINGYDNKA